MSEYDREPTGRLLVCAKEKQQNPIEFTSMKHDTFPLIFNIEKPYNQRIMENSKTSTKLWSQKLKPRHNELVGSRRRHKNRAKLCYVGAFNKPDELIYKNSKLFMKTSADETSQASLHMRRERRFVSVFLFFLKKFDTTADRGDKKEAEKKVM